MKYHIDLSKSMRNMAGRSDSRELRKREGKHSPKRTQVDTGDAEIKALLKSMAAQLNRLEAIMEAKASKESVDELTSRVDALETKETNHDDLVKRVEELEALEEAVGGQERSETEQMVKDEVRKGIDEYREREARKLNLILHNVPEPQGETPEQRKLQDMEQVDKILEDIGCPMAKSESAFRLGKVIPNKTRLLKVRLPSSTLKRDALSKAKTLRHSTVEDNRKIYISPDLTPAAREEGKRVRELLKLRRDKGETNLVIRRGEIVRDPTVRHPRGTETPGGHLRMTIRNGRIVSDQNHPVEDHPTTSSPVSRESR